MKLGFLYAGQGSQHPGMGADLYETYPAFRRIYDSATLDFDLKTVSFTDPNGILNETQYTQPCMAAFAIGLTDVLREQGIRPVVAAGLSLGEYSALYAAGVWDASTTLRTVAFRGKTMADAATGIPCAMFAVLGLERTVVQAVCQEAKGTVWPCNFNCPGQIVIGGETEAVNRAVELAKGQGARRCLPLKVSGPFHTPLLKSAGDALSDYFQEIHFAKPAIPVLFNTLGREMDETTTIPALLERQVQSSVYMEDCIRRMAELGVDAMVEIGPGKALTGFVRKTVRGLPVFPVETVEDVVALPEKLKGVNT